MLLLADGSGNTSGVGTTVPGSVFQYSYQYPQDCQRIRYIPWNPYQAGAVPTGNITPANSSSPLTSGVQAAQMWQPVRPSRFVITTDPNFPTAPGPDGTNLQGQSPIGQRVVLTNVQNASCVYTFDAVYPSLWDSLFLDAMVAYLASEVAVPLWTDKNPGLGMQFRNTQIAIAKDKISTARVADGNEMTVSTEHLASWNSARFTGGGYGYGWGVGPFAGGADWGVWGGGWAGSVGFSDGSSY